MIFDDSFAWVRFPNEQETMFDDRIPYEDAVEVLSSESAGNPELLSKLKLENERRMSN